MNVNNSFNEPIDNIEYWQSLNPIKDYKIEVPGEVVAIFLKVHDQNMITKSENLPSLAQVFKLIVDNKEILKKPSLASLEALRSIMSKILSLVNDRKTSNLIDDTFLESLSEIILPHLSLYTHSQVDRGRKGAITASLSVIITLMPKDNVSNTTLAKVKKLSSMIIID